MHPQTAAWLKDLDFTDSEEVHASTKGQHAHALSIKLFVKNVAAIQDTQSAHTVNAEDVGTDSSSSCRGLSLPSLPAEVLFAVIDMLDLPALACFTQTCKNIRAACLTDAVWDRLCDGKGPRHGQHPHKYHKPRPSHSTDIRQTTPDASKPDHMPPRVATLTFACEQVRYTYFDNNLRLKYSSGLVVDPAWLSLLPKVSSQGSSWLYVKAKTLSGVLSCITTLRQHIKPAVMRYPSRIVCSHIRFRIPQSAVTCHCNVTLPISAASNLTLMPT